MPILRNRIADERGSTSQRALAKQVNIISSKMSVIERGIQVPDKDEALRIAQYFCRTSETLEQALLRTFDRIDYDFLFRNKIAETRIAQEKSRKELADELGIDESTLMDLEHGVRGPTAQQKKQLLRILNKSYEEVFVPYERQ